MIYVFNLNKTHNRFCDMEKKMNTCLPNPRMVLLQELFNIVNVICPGKSLSKIRILLHVEKEVFIRSLITIMIRHKIRCSIFEC